MTETLLLASSLSARGASVVRAVSPAVCAGLAVGAESMNPKQWPCEDSLAVIELEDGGLLAAVADAHWGGLSGEVVASGLAAAWREARASEPVTRLRQALFLLDGRLGERGDDGSETTALLVHVKDRRVSWANVGDSLLLVLGRTGGMAIKNQPSPMFAGGRPLAALPVPPESGSATLAPGDVVLLASDGVLPEAQAFEPPELVATLRRPAPLVERITALLRLTNERGRDNLGLVAIET